MHMPTNILCVVLLTLSFFTAAVAKDEPTYYTPERIASARANIDRYDWAQRELGSIKRGDGFDYYTGKPHGPANTYADIGDEFMWLLMPSTVIPRHVESRYKAQSPGHTEQLRALDPWCGFTIDQTPIQSPLQGFRQALSHQRLSPGGHDQR